MRRLLFIIGLTIIGCTPRIPEMRALLDAPENIIIPFDSTFLEFAEVIRYFEAENAQLPDSTRRVVFTGSSSIRMWDSLAVDMDTLGDYLVVNRGFGGSILPEVNYYFDALLSDPAPDLIVLYCGENDITDGYSPKVVYESFRTFLRLFLHRTPDAKLLYIGLKPSPSRWELWPQFRETNRAIAQLIRRLDSPQIRYLDPAPIMLSPLDGRPDTTIFLGDGLHMNREGYLRWRTLVVPALQQMINC